MGWLVLSLSGQYQTWAELFVLVKRSSLFWRNTTNYQTRKGFITFVPVWACSYLTTSRWAVETTTGFWLGADFTNIFTIVTYRRSKISWHVLKTSHFHPHFLPGSIRTLDFKMSGGHIDRTRANTLRCFCLFFPSFEHVKSLLIMGPNNTKNQSKSVIF